MNKLKQYFFTGLIIFLPIALIVQLLHITVTTADRFFGIFLKPYFTKELGFYSQTFSLIFCILLIFSLGVFVTNFAGRKIHEIFEAFLVRIPFFKQVYPASKEISSFLFSKEKFNFRQSVLIPYPRPGIYSLGFLTNEGPKTMSQKTNTELCHVFVPHTPQLLSGFFTVVPRKDLIFPELTIEQAVKFIMTGGIIKIE